VKEAKFPNRPSREMLIHNIGAAADEAQFDPFPAALRSFEVS
jgi:hypothetical protein